MTRLQLAGRHCPLGGGAWLPGRADSHRDRTALRPGRAAESDTYCDEVSGIARGARPRSPNFPRICKASSSRCIRPTTTPFDGFAPPELAAIRRRAGVGRAVAQGGASLAPARPDRACHLLRRAAWPYLYPWPQRPAGLIEAAFDELAARWRPILDAFDEAGVDVCYEIHPGEDLHDGATFEMFLAG